MSDASRGLADLSELMSRPLFTLGSSGISIGRILLALALTLTVVWLSRLCERGLQRLAARRRRHPGLRSHLHGRPERQSNDAFPEASGSGQDQRGRDEAAEVVAHRLMSGPVSPEGVGRVERCSYCNWD